MQRNIANSFDDYFEMVPADTEALKVAVYQLRYQVFCLETGFEDKAQFPDGLEMDEYDSLAQHYLIRHRTTGVYAATTRLIFADQRDPERLFPIERHCRLTATKKLAGIPRRELAEVSRFCVSAQFKRRPGEHGTIAGVGAEKHLQALTSEEERRAWPHITLALIACLNRMSLASDISHWYAVMEPSLIRLLGMMGINFVPVGPPTEYHGLRQPCITQVPDYLQGVKEKNFPIWEMLTDRGSFWKGNREVA